MEETRIIEKSKYCQRCKNETTAVLVRTISTSGVSMVYWCCKTCKRSISAPTQWIKHDLLQKYKIDPASLPVAEDYSPGQVCAVCRKTGTEYHHFAPKHLFGEDEAEKWPTAYLCKPHHDEWHQRVDKIRGNHGRAV